MSGDKAVTEGREGQCKGGQGVGQGHLGKIFEARDLVVGIQQVEPTLVVDLKV